MADRLPSYDSELPDDPVTTVQGPRLLPSTIPPAPRTGMTPSFGMRIPGFASAEPARSARWASAPAWVADAGEAVRGRLPLAVREKVQSYPGAKVFTAAAVVGLAFCGLFAGLGGLTYRAFKSSPEKPVSAAPVAATVLPAPTMTHASAPPPAPKVTETKAPDEAKVLLDFAEAELAAHRAGEVPGVLQRLLAREPTIKDDARFKRILLAVAGSDDARASSDAQALLSGPMGETGAALAYELSLQPELRDAARRRVQKWLGSKDFERVAPLTVYAAAKLRAAKTCEDKHALLDFAGDVGGSYVLTYLRELERQTTCKPDDLLHCQPCMGSDSRLTDTIAKVSHSAQ